MAKRMTPSQFKSKIRQLEQKQKRAINDMNREINNYNREVKKAVKNNELRKLNNMTTVRTSFTVSSRAMQQHYEDVERVYYEGVSVTPEQERILDLIEQEQANSLITENYIEGDNVPEESPEDIEIGDKLALVSDDLNNRWKGAVFALNPNNPDATRHFCTSAREIFTEFLEIQAPNEKVFAYNPHCQKTGRGDATRREKIKYMMRNTNIDESVVSFVEADIKNILELNQLLSGGTHGPAGKFTFTKLVQVKKRVEQGINFLCEISRLT